MSLKKSHSICSAGSDGWDFWQAHREFFRHQWYRWQNRGKATATNFSREPIAPFKERKTGEAVAAERVITKREKELRLQILDTDVNRVTLYSVSPSCLIDWALSSSPLHEDEDVKADKHHPQHRSCSCPRHRYDGKDEKCMSISKINRIRRDTLRLRLQLSLDPQL